MPGVGRIHLEIKRGGLDGLLLIAGQTGEAVRESVGDAEFHQSTRNTFITSSPR